VPRHHAAIDAAAEAGVELIAYTSIVNPGRGEPRRVVPDHRATEERMLASGVAWTFLRNSLYADLQAGNLAASEASGQLVTNAGAGEVAYVARDDVAAAAAAVITGADHAGEAYDITGPEALDAEDRAEVFATIAGRPIEVIQVDEEAFAAGVAEATGYPIEVAGCSRASAAQRARGNSSLRARISSSSPAGPPTSLRSVLGAKGASVTV
jgi:NAD(P)H dehydrogenase (quinone)